MKASLSFSVTLETLTRECFLGTVYVMAQARGTRRVNYSFQFRVDAFAVSLVPIWPVHAQRVYCYGLCAR